MLKPLNIECPACGAKVSESCMTLTDETMGESHTKRKLAALAKEYPGEVASRVEVQMSNCRREQRTTQSTVLCTG